MFISTSVRLVEVCLENNGSVVLVARDCGTLLEIEIWTAYRFDYEPIRNVWKFRNFIAICLGEFSLNIKYVKLIIIPWIFFIQMKKSFFTRKMYLFFDTRAILIKIHQLCKVYALILTKYFIFYFKIKSFFVAVLTNCVKLTLTLILLKYFFCSIWNDLTILFMSIIAVNGQNDMK